MAAPPIATAFARATRVLVPFGLVVRPLVKTGDDGVAQLGKRRPSEDTQGDGFPDTGPVR